MKLKFSYYLVVAILLLLPSAALAEFRQSGLSTFQDISGHSKVVVVSTAFSPPGIYLTWLEKPVSIQEYHPSGETGVASSAFLKFDSKKNKFSTLVTGAKEYQLRANSSFTVQIGDGLTAAIDQNEFNQNPYVSITDSESGVLVLVGLTVLGNYKGSDAVALYSANQISKSDKGLIKPYFVSTTGDLFLGNSEKGSPLPLDTRLGLPLEIHNECLTGLAFLNEEESRKLLGKKEATEQDLKQGLLRSGHVEIDFLLLRVTDEILALDYVANEFKRIKPLAIGRTRACTVVKF